MKGRIVRAKISRDTPKSVVSRHGEKIYRITTTKATTKLIFRYPSK
jgi:hypothetical protein